MDTDVIVPKRIHLALGVGRVLGHIRLCGHCPNRRKMNVFGFVRGNNLAPHSPCVGNARIDPKRLYLALCGNFVALYKAIWTLT